ncbi:glycosyltransferase family 2 protein [Vibrio splendidus]|uniref:glycosyltransferase family 2 protein n=1 Tax=Vibrio splendidus TaxID=29497 RepID=UPI00076A5692|nr:glycosyltransferase [Vibrio splendidus]
MISVILPVYNGEEYIYEAINSLLEQSFSDFEVICIDDGSKDATKRIIENIASKDNRIRLISRENKGLIYTLNEALSLCKYDYIARMDADDICLPNRLSLQLEFLLRNPTVAVVGSRYHYIDESSKINGIRKSPTSNFLLKVLLTFGSPFGHPTVMINRKVVTDDLYYDPKYKAAEDYELWLRLSKKYRFACIKKPLLLYRVLDSSISRSQREIQLTSMVNAMLLHLFKCKVERDKIRTFLNGKLSFISSVHLISFQKSNFLIRLGSIFLLAIIRLKRRLVSLKL